MYASHLASRQHTPDSDTFRGMRRAAIGAATLVTASGISLSPGARSAPAIPTLRPQVVAIHPHDEGAFTQGLVVHDGELVESTGLYGASTIRATDPRTGRVRTRAFLSPDVFGEGVTLFSDTLYVLSWREHTCFLYGLDFIPRGQKTYEGEGWGLTHDDANLILSDGSSTLRFVDPKTFKVVRTLAVTENGKPVINLNELELIRGRIWANVWLSDRIVQIDPASGEVVAVVDLSGLESHADKNDRDAVANGIAFDEAHDKIYVTGKRWPRLFEIRVPAAR
jgi:glutamine cyclotransferase